LTVGFLSRTLGRLSSLFKDTFYRSSLTLLANTAATSAIGFVFWTLAARRYSPSSVGVFVGVTSGVGLLAAIAALGLPNMMVRHITTAENPRELVVMAVTAITTVGTALCLVTVVGLGPITPPSLHLRQHGEMISLVIALVVFTAVGGTFDAGLVATRSSHAVLIKNLIGSTVKVGALFLLTSFRSLGLLISYGLGLMLATIIGGVVLNRQIGGKRVGFRSFRALPHYLSATSGNYLATIMGILPVSLVPLEVLAVRGAAETAKFAVAFLIAGFLNFIPSTVAQVLFAEASRQGVPLAGQLRKAIRGVYGLLLPALVVVVAAAPLLLRLFGPAYAAAATGCLRVLALSALLTGGTYIVDSMLIARDRTVAYVFMNGANAALVLACVGILLPRGLVAAAAGWALAQGSSLLLGLIVLATGTVGRHHPRISPAPASHGPHYPPRESQHPQSGVPPRRVIYAFEPQIRELLTTWPMMPTTLVAESIGWDQPIQVLLSRVTEIRSTYSQPYEPGSGAMYMAGRMAQCGLWFPPIDIPVGFGQTRTARQLPVLTMITGYSHRLLATLIPSTDANDVLAGLWDLITTLGAVPQVLTWDDPGVIGLPEERQVEFIDKFASFSRTLGAKLITGTAADPTTRGLIEWAHVYLEHAFLYGRTFASPADFNRQLHNWLDAVNAQQADVPNSSPAESISTDRKAMLPLPAVPPPTEWRLSMTAGNRPFLHFDANDYSVHPSVIGRRVELVASLSQVRVLCEGKVAADHDRVWARGRTITDPAHAAIFRDGSAGR
jgi:O-antigen/teichoic acid export membrane protein